MKTKLCTKCLAMILALVMVIGVVPMNVLAAVIDYEAHDDYYKVISKDDYELAPGIVESEIVLNNAEGSHRQVAHVVEVDLNNEYTKVIPSYKGMAEGLNEQKYGVQIMSEQAKWAEANGYGNVVAAMNLSLSWYDSAYYEVEHPELIGEPLGYVVLDGQVYTNSRGQSTGAETCVVINFDEKNGEARPADMPKVQIRSTREAITGWEEQVIPANFGFLVKNGVNQYKKDNNASNGASRSFVGVKEDGTLVMVMNDGRQSPYSAGFTSYEMAEFMLSLGCVAAINGDGGGSSTFLSQRPGEELKLNCSPSDGAERPTTHGILVITSAPATGEFVRANITTENEYYTPNSTVEFKALGTDLVGTEAPIPTDAIWQIKENDMGTISDGVFVSNGTCGTVTAQMVYNGDVVGEKSIEIVIPEEFVFAQNTITVPFDKEVVIGLKATINGGLNEVVLKENDVIFTTTNNELGSFDGFKFTSVSETNAPANLTSTLTATLNFGENLSATATLSLGKGSEVLFDFDSEADIAEWGVGEVNGNDAGFVREISYATAENGEVHNGEGSLKLETNGLSAPNVNAGSYAQVDLFLKEPIIVENAKSIGFWAYLPDEYEHCWIRVLYWYDANNDGIFEKKNTISVINQPTVYNTWDESGWKYFSVDVSAYEKVLIPGLSDKTNFGYAAGKNDANNFRFIEFMFPHTNTNDLWKTYGTINGPYTIYVDNITADFSDAVDDREAPSFNSINLLENDSEIALEKNNVVTTKNNKLNVSAKVTEDTTKSNATGLNPNSAKAYIDGVEVDFNYSNGRFTISDIAVADGVHRVKFEISDMMGNKAVVIRLVNVESGVESSTVQVVPKNTELDRLYGGSVYWMDVNATNIETIQSVSTTIDLNSVNHWELAHMEVVEGFSAEYVIDEETNTANITITRTGENVQTGFATLASLPIRIISFDTDIHMEGYTAETYWKTFDFWPQDLKVDVDKGEISFVDGYESHGLNTFSNEEFSVDTEMYTSGANMDAAFKTERGTAHVHSAEALEKAPTCTEKGLIDATYCQICDSVVDWGTIVDATGHEYEFVDGVLKCACDALFNGIYEDGKTYVDGVVVADGWIEESYYKDGVKLTGVHVIDGKYYNFGDAGVCANKYPMSAEWYTNENGESRYMSNGIPLTDYQCIETVPTYFNETGIALNGEIVINGETCIFERGVFVESTSANVLTAGMAGPKAYFVLYENGTFVLTGEGKTYDYLQKGEATGPIEERSFRNRPWGTGTESYALKIKNIVIGKDITSLGGRTFNLCHNVRSVEFETGSKLTHINVGALCGSNYMTEIVIPNGVKYLDYNALGSNSVLVNVYLPTSIKYIDANAFSSSKKVILNVVKGSYAETFAQNNGISYKNYEEEKKAGFFVEDGELFYYINGEKWTRRGVFQVEDNFYYAKADGSLVRNSRIWASVTNDLVPYDIYSFDADGKMEIKNGFYEEDGELFYYEQGVKWTRRGVFKVEDSFYYAKSDGSLVRDSRIWASVTNDLVPYDIYYFDVDGKMEIKNGFYEEENELYYYVDGEKWTRRGVFQVGDYFYYAKTNGSLVRDSRIWASVTNDLVPYDIYYFDTDGKMEIKNGFCEENGELYYYEMGIKWTRRGVFQVGEDYYYAKADGSLVRDSRIWASVTNDLVPYDIYYFDADGKMLID